MTEAITSFNGEYRWLSNFWDAKVTLDGDEYPTVEHAYQAAKFEQGSVGRAAVAKTLTPGQAKRAGRMFKIRPEWDDVKYDVMLALSVQKYADPELQRKLLNTGDADLIEGNTWGDTYWGVCNGVGQNKLGDILKRVRTGYLLMNMAAVYPGDPDGSIGRDIAELFGQEYVAPQVTFDPPQCQECHGSGRDREGSRCQECGGNGVGPQGGLHPKAAALRSGDDTSEGMFS